MFYQKEKTKIENIGVLFSFYILFVLRFILIIFPNYFFDYNKNGWCIYSIGTYLFTLILIYFERKRLIDFKIDKISLSIIVFLKPLEPIILALVYKMDSQLSLSNIGGKVLVGISLLFLPVYLKIMKGMNTSNRQLSPLLIGFILGFICLIIKSFFQLESTINMSIENGFSLLLSFSAIYEVFYQMSYAAISEEPFFRGFVWGYLEKLKLNTILIVFIQIVLFTLGHLFYFKNNPISFFVYVPLTTLFLCIGIIVTKKLSASIVTHSIVNSLSPPINIIMNGLVK